MWLKETLDAYFLLKTTKKKEIQSLRAALYLITALWIEYEWVWLKAWCSFSLWWARCLFCWPMNNVWLSVWEATHLELFWYLWSRPCPNIHTSLRPGVPWERYISIIWRTHWSKFDTLLNSEDSVPINLHIFRILKQPGSAPSEGPTGPFFSFGGHLEEGYSMDWSKVTEGR